MWPLSTEEHNITLPRGRRNAHIHLSGLCNGFCGPKFVLCLTVWKYRRWRTHRGVRLSEPPLTDQSSKSLRSKRWKQPTTLRPRQSSVESGLFSEAEIRHLSLGSWLVSMRDWTFVSLQQCMFEYTAVFRDWITRTSLGGAISRWRARYETYSFAHKVSAHRPNK